MKTPVSVDQMVGLKLERIVSGILDADPSVAQEAFGQFQYLFRRQVMRAAARKFLSAEDIEDLTAVVFNELWKKRAQIFANFEMDRFLRSTLPSIVKRRVIEHVRKLLRRQGLATMLPYDGEAVDASRSAASKEDLLIAIIDAERKGKLPADAHMAQLLY